MKSRIIILLTTTLTFFSCELKDKKEKKLSQNFSEIIIENPDNSNKNINLSKIANGIKYVKLGTSSKSLICSPFRAIFFDKKIFILDDKTRSLVVFNQYGNPICNIDKTGRGPKEVAYIRDFTIDRINKIIEILDIGNKKLIKFDFNGKLISEEKFTDSYLGYYFGKLNNGKYLFFNNNLSPNKSITHNIIVRNNLLKTVKEMLPIRKELINYRLSLPNKLVKYDNGYNLTLYLSDTIFHLTDTSVSKRYYVNFCQHKIPDELFPQLQEIYNLKNNQRTKKKLKLMNSINEKYASNISNIFETNNSFFFQYIYQFKLNSVFYNKNTESTLCAGKILNDFDNGIFGSPIGISEENELVTMIYPFDLMEHINNIEKSFTKDEWKNLKQGKMNDIIKLTEDLKNLDNPILMFINLKEEW